LTTNTSADVQLIWGVKIPMRDGVHLHATLYIPRKHETPTPAIFMLTPYIGQSHHDRGVHLAAHGFPFLAVDVRGRGGSEGTFRPHVHDAQDGYDIVEWLAHQPYCNGKVAMCGGSYMGYVQWATARECPPHLMTILPVASPFRGVDSPLRNGVFPTYALRWLMLVSGSTSQERVFADQSFWNRQFTRWFQAGVPFAALDAFVGQPSPVFQEWISHPERDAYWDAFNPSAEQYARISIPILTITGAYDGDQPGALMHYREHLENATDAARAQHYLIIGPWDHAGTRNPKTEFCGIEVGPASLLDLHGLHLQWYAWTMQGGPKPEFLHERVAYYVMGAEEWRYADSLEAITARYEPLYLQSTSNPVDVFHSGSLTAEPHVDRDADHYVYDPRDVSLAELESTVDPENRVDQRMTHARIGKQLIYHSGPFTRDTELSGFFKLSVWLSIDQPDTDFHVAVYEVCIDGRVIQLTADWMRARYRESPHEETLIDTRAPLRYNFERFTFVSRRISSGNRLRLVIGPLSSIYSQKNYNSGGAVSEESVKDARTVTVMLFHDEAHPSALYVPQGQP
jgi:putative CocE/NonD family hydrolase